MKALVLSASLALGCGSQEALDSEPAADVGELVGGTVDLRWPAAGYLVHAATAEEAETAPVACGATLIAPDLLVTAAHCVLTAPDEVWAFGSGHAGSAPLTPVASVRVHPEFHPEPQSSVDVRYYLRNFDVATVRLERPLDIEPARLPEAKTPVGCRYKAIGYRAEGAAPAERKSTGACVLFRANLGGDPIFEVHPTGHSALCHGDGDEGSPLLGDGSEPIVHGIYVGSVTQGLTDCRRGTQYLNGYESMFGFRDFLQQSLDEGL